MSVRIELVAIFALCGCRQLLGFETASQAPDDAPENGGERAPLVDASGDATADAAVSGCPASYATMSTTSTSYYRFSIIQRDWISAAQDCADDDDTLSTGRHTHLIVLDNDQERAAIAAETPAGIGGWIGLTDRVNEGVYLAVSNQLGIAYPPSSGGPWGNTEPDGGTAENCVVMNGNDKLETLACTVQQFYGCECDDSADDPANY